MEKRGGAVQESHERQREGSMLIGRAAQLSGEAALQEFERGHVILAGEGDGPVIGDEAEIVGMGYKEVENAVASLRGGARRLDGGEEIEAGAAAEEGKEIFLVGEALVESGCGGARGACDGAHGESMFAAGGPEAVSSVEDPAFETGVRFARHAGAPSVFYAWDYSLYAVKETMYK